MTPVSGSSLNAAALKTKTKTACHHVTVSPRLAVMTDATFERLAGRDAAS
jgi:hypothetical protein